MKIARAALALAVISIASKIMGFMREVFLAYFYGASSTSDAYLVALVIPGSVFAIVGVGLSVAFIPSYVGIKRADRRNFVRNLIGLVFLIGSIVVLLVLTFAENIVGVVAPGFSGETSSLASLFTRVFVFGVYVSGLLHIFTGILHAEGRLVVPGLAGLAFSLIVALSIVLSAKYGLIVLIAGPLLAKFIQISLMWPAVRRFDISLMPKLDLTDRDVRNVVLMTAPIALGVGASEVNALVTRALASGVEVGAVSALTYAHQLSQVVVGIVGMSIATTIFPALSRMFGEGGDVEGGNRLVAAGLSYATFLVLPASLFFAVFSSEIVSVVYGRGEFGRDAIRMTGGALFFYSCGMVFVVMREVIARAFYALKDAKTPVNNAIVGVVLNIVLSFFLAPRLGVEGLALAASISAAVTTALLLRSSRIRLDSAVARDWIREFLVLLAIGLVSVWISKMASSMVLFSEVAWLIIFQCGILFFVVFLGLSFMLRVRPAVLGVRIVGGRLASLLMKR